MNLRQAHVLVTGGTRGIGEQLVRELLAQGARVTATGTTDASVAQARQRMPGAAWAVLDQGSASGRHAFLAGAGGDDFQVVIHNAGVQQVRDWAEPEQPVGFDTEQEMQVNFIGPVELTRALLPRLTRHEAAAVVFVTSGLALAPKQSSPVYCASKAALRSFAKSLRAQLQKAGATVRVIEALPPIVDTDMTRGRGRGKISAQDAARQILAGIAGGKREIDIGLTRLLRFLLRLSPSLGERIMIKN